MIPILPHWSAEHATVKAIDNELPRYCAEITSHPETLVTEPRYHPCSRQAFDETGDCEACGVAWARHGGGER